MRLASMIVVVLAAATPLSAHAQKSMSPGQYEYNVKMEIPGMPFPLPPVTAQNCLTQADIDKGNQYQNQNQDEECQVKNLKQSPGKASMDFVCKDGTTGRGDYTFTDTGMTGKTVMTKDGTPMTMNMTAKRIGDCK